MIRRVIYKHRLELVEGPQVVEVWGPGAEVLDFQLQNGVLTIWTLEHYHRNSDATEERFLILGTGSEVESGWEYVGTVQDRAMVWHLFRGIK